MCMVVKVAKAFQLTTIHQKFVGANQGTGKRQTPLCMDHVQADFCVSKSLLCSYPPSHALTVLFFKRNQLLFRCRVQGNLLRCVCVRPHLRTLMTRKSCAVGIRNAKLRNYLKCKTSSCFCTQLRRARSEKMYHDIFAFIMGLTARCVHVPPEIHT